MSDTVSIEDADRLGEHQGLMRLDLQTTHTRWSTVKAQLVLASLIGFCCPGMMNALNGMGGGGNVDPTISAYASSALMITSAVAYFLICVPLFEIVGVRSMSLGCWTYALYPAGLLLYSINGDGGLVVFGGVLLGVGSAFFWLVQGSMMISYPLSKDKGKAIASFWIVFNLGGMVGALIAFAQNTGANEGTVNTGTYTLFIVIMLVGEGLTFYLLPPAQVRREENTTVAPSTRTDTTSNLTDFGHIVKRELNSLLAIQQEKRVAYLVPMFFTANFFYSYQQNVMNGLSFDLQGRTFNSALYWAAQIFGGLAIPVICDFPPLPTRSRAIVAWTCLFIFGNITMLTGSSFETQRQEHEEVWIRFRGPGYWAGAGLYFAYGMLDALWQGLCYWLLGVSCSSPLAAGKLVAIYKVTQAIGAGIAYALTSSGVDGGIQFTSNWILVVATLLIALPAVLAVDETNQSDGEYSRLPTHTS